MQNKPGNGGARKSRQRKSYASPQNKDDIKKRLADEYKILQDKIDKIGAFRFTIKGWAVAAVGAATAAASATKSLASALIFSFGLAIFVTFFFIFEVEQVRLSRLFGSLAGRIERVFDEIDRKDLMRPYSSPVIGTEIVKANQLRNGRKRFKWWMFWHYFDAQHHSARQIWWGGLREEWTVFRQAHICFYSFLLVLSFVTISVQYKAQTEDVARALSSNHAASSITSSLPGASKGSPAR